MSDDPVAAALAEIREGERAAPRAAMRRLLKAAEAALKLADDWTAEANRITGIFASDEDPWPRTVGGMRADAFEKCARELREATAAALAGTQLGEDGDHDRTA